MYSKRTSRPGRDDGIAYVCDHQADCIPGLSDKSTGTANAAAHNIAKISAHARFFIDLSFLQLKLHRNCNYPFFTGTGG